MESTQKRIGKRVKELREKCKMKQKAVAEALNISVSAYAKLEAGDRGISSENCIALADLFGVSCDYILRGIEATNLDICAETCLHQSTIDALKAKKKQLRRFHDKQQEMSLDTRPLGLEDTALFLGLGPGISYYTVEEYIINSFFEKHWLSSKLRDAVLMGINGTIDEINEGVNFEITMGTWFVGESISYKKETAAYLASKVFSEYFMEIFTNADLLRKMKVLPDEDIQAAIERGLLHE